MFSPAGLNDYGCAERLHSTVPPPPPANHGIPSEAVGGAEGAGGSGSLTRHQHSAEPPDRAAPPRLGSPSGDADDRALGRPRKPKQLALGAFLRLTQVDHDAPDIVDVHWGRDPQRSASQSWNSLSAWTASLRKRQSMSLW